MKKIPPILLEASPILLMIGLIPIIQNDYVLTLVDIGIIAVSLAFRRYKDDFIVLFFGFFVMILFEYFFISTGVETFKRNSFLGLMPLWLPFLWGYGFVAIKRSIEIINTQNYERK